MKKYLSLLLLLLLLGCAGKNAAPTAETAPTAAPKADLSASLEDRPVGGLGIHLVPSIMDSISYKRLDGKNVLTMIINL